MPGGGVDSGETPEQCISRELKEELDICGDILDYKLGEYHTRAEGKRDGIHIYVIRLLSAKFTKHWELADAAWFPIDELPKDLSVATGKRIVELKNGEKNIKREW